MRTAWDDLDAVKDRLGWYVARRSGVITAGLAVAVAAGCFGMNRGHPEPNPVRGYRLEIAQDDGAFRPLNIGAQGQGCKIFLPDRGAYRTCLIATNVHPGVIGSDESVITRPVVDAMIWKARADADVSVCGRGRLADAFLEECERAASEADYEYQGEAVRVRVPIGGAEPTPTRSTG